MLYHTYFLTIGLIPLYFSLCTGDALKDFILIKMQEYPIWLRGNYDDPSPVISGPTNISLRVGLLKLDCFLSNHGVAGYSENPGNARIMDGSLPSGHIKFYHFSPGTTFAGDFVANGSILTLFPISDSGRWSITFPQIMTILDLSFYINPSGYLNYTEPHPSIGYFTDEKPVVYFEGLRDNSNLTDYIEYIEEAILVEFLAYVNRSKDHPFIAPFVTYIEKTLNETSLVDIIGTTTSKSEPEARATADRFMFIGPAQNKVADQRRKIY